MKSPQKIIGINVIPKLKLLLEEDIITLSKLSLKESEESKLKQLIVSLIEAKKTILNLLPGPKLYPEPIPTTPTQMSVETINKTNITKIKDQYKLPKILLKIEMDQMAYIQKAATGVGLPEGFQKTMDQILGKYIQITHQLDRSIKTNQLNPIVLS
jgi:hypothetical protein